HRDAVPGAAAGGVRRRSGGTSARWPRRADARRLAIDDRARPDAGPQPLPAPARDHRRDRLLVPRAPGAPALWRPRAPAGLSRREAGAGDGVPLRLQRYAPLVGHGRRRGTRLRPRAGPGAPLARRGRLAPLPLLRRRRTGFPLVPVGQPAPRVDLLRALRRARRLAPARRAAA